MLFNSPGFALFLPAMLIIYWTLRGSARRWALLAGSYLFYACWDWRFCGLLMLSTAVDYSCARAMERWPDQTARRRSLMISLATNLGVLATFKYFNFFRDSAEAVLHGLGFNAHWSVVDIVLPMGISFYTFQTISYTIDVYRGGRAERNFRDFALFVACFPQLVAGPIMRARDLLPQLKTEHRFEDVDLSGGVYRIFRGLFKKMVVADTLALYVDMVFADPVGFTGVSAWIALYAYAFQIYMDFSGYCDVAVGAGRLLGLKLTENFDRPYLATSPSDFWRRWHITLSTWLRDYVYIPLGGSRVSRLCTVRNLFITMALGGLWHGAAWTFVAWGVYHAVLLTGERILRGGRRATLVSDERAGVRLIKIVVMFHLTCLGWMLFRAPDWATVQTMLANLYYFSGNEVYGLRIGVVVVICAMVHAAPTARILHEHFARASAFAQGMVAGVIMLVLLTVSPDIRPFIYFRF